MNKQLIK